MRRFFYPVDDTPTALPLKDLGIGASIRLPDGVHHHWCRVLRACVGEQGILFDGYGGEYVVELSEIGKKSAQVRVLSHHDSDRCAPMCVMIGLVMSRGDRMDYAIQKATEMGVTAIALLSSQHGEVHLKPNQIDKKLAHWQQIALSACEQCGLNRPPLIFAPQPIETWLTETGLKKPASTLARIHVDPSVRPLLQQNHYQPLQQAADINLVLSVPPYMAGDDNNNDNHNDGNHGDGDGNQQGMTSSQTATDHPPYRQHWQSLLSSLKQPHVQLLIGAEGGLSDSEVSHAIAQGFIPWQIGERVLRTETAPVVALAYLQAWLTR